MLRIIEASDVLVLQVPLKVIIRLLVGYHLAVGLDQPPD